jgi:predicted nucleotidyltransferase
MSAPAMELPLDEIAEICRTYHVANLSLFGSALRDDFRSDSDLDFLVEFEAGERVSLFDLVHLQRALGELLGRQIDVISRAGLERSANWMRRKSILSNATSIYVAR